MYAFIFRGDFMKHKGTGRPRKDFTGKRFGKLVVIEEAERSPNHISRWVCLCDCGNNVVVLSSNLVAKRTNSCGCGKKSFKVTNWTDERDDDLIRRINDKLNKNDVADDMGISISALTFRLHQLKKEKNIIMCLMCKRYFKGKTYHAKFCENKCRWRYHERIKVESRRKNKVCLQCGSEYNRTHKRKHCLNCKEYFSNRYHKKKEG